jgi:phospholipase/carboxylesterase
MSEFLPCVEIDPPGKPEGVVVWLHGLGADGHDFEPIVPILGLPRARFVFPHAPRAPVTINGGMVMPAWYDIVAIGGGGANEADVRRSAKQLRALLEREEQNGVPADRIILAGFSQGGAMALHVGTRYPRALRGIMVLSGYEVLPPTREREETPANRMTPMLFCHGTADPLVPIAAGRLAYEAHVRPERPAEWHEFPMAHEVSPSELTVIRQWLGARFGRAA